MHSCAHNKKLYTSDCSADISYKKIGYAALADSITHYDKQYVEVSGRFAEGKDLSALVNDSLYAIHGESRAFWINFSQDCPLYLKGTHQGFFASEDGAGNKLNDRMVTVRGRVDLRQKGHNKAYRATIDDISYIEIE
ncbi:hypothetical protein [Mucilaginibacter pedocola]|uniref:hypothetical protein n=1 Tax=Mucilaginibacter pedocola TaxID=1792845 RepID=UPI00117CB2B1|nr:hypothetical protein [Mucilaginibacter pedocola]